MSNKAIILLGSNLGDKNAYLEIAINKIFARIGVIELMSSIYETSAWGIEDQPTFLNQVIVVQTNNSAFETMLDLLEIEKEIGRVRFEKWGERIIDLDILYFNDEIFTEENCTIPHPSIAERKFTLIPLVEIVPLYIHPINKLNQIEMLFKCSDKGEVIKHGKRN